MFIKEKAVVPVPELERDRVREGVAMANLPALLCVLYQLTGEERWLQAPYLPSRSRGLDDNDDGGFPEPVRDEIRTAANQALMDWIDGKPVAVPAPTREMLARMLSVSMNEPVPEEYGEII